MYENLFQDLAKRLRKITVNNTTSSIKLYVMISVLHILYCFNAANGKNKDFRNIIKCINYLRLDLFVMV